MQINFFTVSLPENIPTLKVSLEQINNFYQSPPFTIICPDVSAHLFTESLARFDNVQILCESSILDLSDFKKLVSQYLTSLNSPIEIHNRLSWYYQQALKLAFAMSQPLGCFPLVMWDADTIPVEKIRFFNNNHSILYGSALEFHLPYFQTMQKIYGVLPQRFSAFTIQFFTCTDQELLCLRERLQQFLPQQENASVSEWVSQIIIQSVYNTHQTFEGSLFSEQELVGLSHMIANGERQRTLTYLRWGFSGLVSSRQMRLIKLLGFKHITFENVENILYKKQGWISLLIFIAKQIYRQRLRPLIAPISR
jgi:hypothetical protein